MFGSQPAYPEKLLHKKESLQNQLINIRVELSQATTVTRAGLHLSGEPPLPRGAPRISVLPREARAGCSWGRTQRPELCLAKRQPVSQAARPHSPWNWRPFQQLYLPQIGMKLRPLVSLAALSSALENPDPGNNVAAWSPSWAQGRPSQLTAWVIARRAAAKAPREVAQRGEQTSRDTPLPFVSFPFFLRFPWPDLGEQEGEGAMLPAAACPHVWRGCCFLLLWFVAGWAVAPLIRLALVCH